METAANRLTSYETSFLVFYHDVTRDDKPVDRYVLQEKLPRTPSLMHRDASVTALAVNLRA